MKPSSCTQPVFVERRGSVRHGVEGVVVWSEGARQRRCRLHDLSWTGAGIEEPGPSPRIGQKLRVKLVVRGRLLGAALAEVVHCSGSERVGLRFVQLDESLSHELDDLFAELS
jgi:hypothetical protein